MKPTISNVVGFLIISCLSTACETAPQKGTATQESPSLYVLRHAGETCNGKKDGRVPDSQKFTIENVRTALDTLLVRSPGTKAIILYVHGRAAGEEEEPNKSLKEVVPCLEREYPATVLMFFWPGSAEGGPLGFPDDHARQAAPGLRQVFVALKKYKEDKSAQLQEKKFVLLLHSMGNIVFEELMRSYEPGYLPHDLFDTIVLSASATATKDHANWLNKTDFSSHLYVTVNNNDPIIDKLGALKIKGRLGKKLETLFSGSVKLASNAIYVDFSKTGVATHRYFLKAGQENNPYIKHFFEAVLSGNAFEFDGFNGVKNVKHRDGTAVYYFKSR